METQRRNCGLKRVSILVAVMLLLCAGNLEAKVFGFKFTNSKDANLIGFSKTFSLMAGQRMKATTRVWRWNPATNKWVEETAGWKPTVTQKPRGTWTVQVDINGAAAVPKGTKLGYTVDVTTQTPGIVRGTDRKYPAPPGNNVVGAKEKVVRGHGAVPASFEDLYNTGLKHRGSVDSVVFPAGEIPVSRFGIVIPPYHYGYFYQLNSETWNGLAGFQIHFSGNVVSSGALPSCHNGEVENDYIISADLFTETLDPDDPIWLTNQPQPVALMQEYAVVPGQSVFWTMEDGYANGSVLLGPGQCSNLVYLISPDPPVRDGLQAHIIDVEGNTSKSMAWGPYIGAIDPDPEELAEQVDPGIGVVTWDYTGVVAPTFNVYFGDDYDCVNDSTCSLGSTPGPGIVIPGLQFATEYFLRVDTVDVAGGGTVYTGPIWSFTTLAPVCDPPLRADTDGDCFVGLNDLSNMAHEWLECRWDLVLLCAP